MTAIEEQTEVDEMEVDRIEDELRMAERKLHSSCSYYAAVVQEKARIQVASAMCLPCACHVPAMCLLCVCYVPATLRWNKDWCLHLHTEPGGGSGTRVNPTLALTLARTCAQH